MALSGTLSSSKYSLSGYNRWVEITWSATQSVANNTSTVSWSAKARCDSSSAWAETWNASYFTINGTRYNIANGTKCYNNTSLGSGSFTVTHNSTGAGSFTWNINVNFYTGGAYNSTGSGTVTLNTIARASSVSVSPTTITCGSTGTISISRASGNFKHTIQILSGSTVIQTLANQTSSTSISWTPSADTYKAIAAGSTGSYTINCITYSGSTNIGSKTCSVTLKMPALTTISANPTSINVGSSTTLTLSKSYSGYKSTIQVYQGSTLVETLQTKVTGTSYTFTPSVATYQPRITGAASVAFTVYCYTYTPDGSTSKGSKTCTITISVPKTPETEPSCTSISLMETSPTMIDLDWGVFVQSQSKIRILAEGTSQASATIKSYNFAGVGADASGFSQVVTTTASSASSSDIELSIAGTNLFTAYVTDSRGYTSSTQSSSITVVPWTAPTLTDIVCTRCDVTGADKDEGTFLHVTGTSLFSDCDGHQGTTASSSSPVITTIYYKLYGQDTWETLWFGSATNGAFDYVFTGSNQEYPEFDVDHAYDIKIQVQDSFKTSTYQDVLTTAHYTMVLRHGGNGVAFGKSSEKDNALESKFDGYFYNKIYGKYDPDDTEFVDVMEQVNKISILSTSVSSLETSVGILENLASNSNALHKQATIAATYGQNKTIASLSLPDGLVYLILGQVYANVSDSATIVSAQIAGSSGPAPMFRGTMQSGGGVSCWAFTRGGRNVNLTSYGYKNATYNLTGHILALPIYLP